MVMLLKNDIEKYFMAEKNESLLFLVLGLVAIGLAFICYLLLKTSFYRGAALALLIIGLIQAVVGYAVYSRSDDQRISNVYAYDMDPQKLKQEELPRMQKVNRNFVVYRWTEILCCVAAVCLVIFHRSNPAGSFWLGLGIALGLQAAIMLLADHFAEKRARAYTQKLEIFMRDHTSRISG
jgi:hypothetical protein